MFQKGIEHNGFCALFRFTTQTFGCQVDSISCIGSKDYIIGSQRGAKYLCANALDLMNDLLLDLSGLTPCLANSIPYRSECGSTGAVVKINIGSDAFNCWDKNTATYQGLPEFIQQFSSRVFL